MKAAFFLRRLFMLDCEVKNLLSSMGVFSLKINEESVMKRLVVVFGLMMCAVACSSTESACSCTGNTGSECACPGGSCECAPCKVK